MPPPNATSRTTAPSTPSPPPSSGSAATTTGSADLSPDGFAAREELTRRALAEVTAATPSDEREAVARDAFLERVGLEVEMHDAGEIRSRMSVIFSELHAVRQVFDMMPQAGRAGLVRRRQPARRRARGPGRLPRHAARGGGPPAGSPRPASTAAIVGQVASWTGRTGDGGDMLGTMVAGCDVDALRPQLQRHAAEANAALDDFATFLEQELVPRGSERDAVGRDRYALHSRDSLGARVDLDETYAWGWEELKRISDDMAATADRVLPGRVVRRGGGPPRGRRVPQGPRPRDVPRLDAGAGRPDRSPSWPTSTSTSPSRSAASSA